MPTKTEYVDPEVFVKHKGVRIYHTYEDDDMDAGRRDYWYTTSQTEGEGSGYEFDVRCLPGVKRGIHDHAAAIKDAIDAGLLKQEERPAPEFRK